MYNLIPITCMRSLLFRLHESYCDSKWMGRLLALVSVVENNLVLLVACSVLAGLVIDYIMFF